MADALSQNLAAMVGVWHDHLQAWAPDGTPVTDDPHGGQPGPFPYDNLVYVDFDGETYTQTNVTFAGRPLKVRTFTATVRDGMLRFDELGPNDPGHVGVAAGPGVIVYCSNRNDHDGVIRYDEPDWIALSGDQRTRSTILYRDGALVRTMTANGTRVSHDTSRRHALDPRDADGPVHEDRSVTHVYERKATT